MFSWFVWEFHRRYPTLPLLYRHHLDSVLNKQMLSSGSHIELIGRVAKELILDHNLSSHVAKEEILSLIYFIVNQLFNELVKFAGAYVATLDITDILDLEEDEEVQALKAKTEPTSTSIMEFYSKAYKIITESSRHRNNSLVKFIRMKILNTNQVNQCILARGLPTEVTGTILSTPIMSNYVTGMYKLYDFMAESRAASTHLFSAEAPLQDTEYFARRLQLVGMVVEGITMQDCGNQQFLHWSVKPPVFRNGRKISDGDLNNLKGKLYVNEETGQLTEITGREEHLYGKSIRIRSVLHCREPNPHRVCATCFGQLHHNVSRFANLGHLCDANLTQQLTQTILSTKHVIGSAIGSTVLLKEDALRYLSFVYQTSALHFRSFNPGSKIRLIIDRNEAVGITDIRLFPNIDQITPKRLSSISSIEIVEDMPNGGQVTIPVLIEQNKRFGHFSQEFLKFVKEKGWATNERDHFVFDMTGWNPRHPVIEIPDMEYSYADHADQIASLIESNTKRLKGQIHPQTPEIVLQELFDLVNSKIRVNLALLEVIIYANTTPGRDDYGLARNRPGSGLHVSRFITANRSLGPAYAYEHQATVISNPRSFFQENRPNSAIDVFMCPKEVVAEQKARVQ